MWRLGVGVRWLSSSANRSAKDLESAIAIGHSRQDFRSVTRLFEQLASQSEPHTISTKLYDFAFDAYVRQSEYPKVFSLYKNVKKFEDKPSPTALLAVNKSFCRLNNGKMAADTMAEMQKLSYYVPLSVLSDTIFNLAKTKAIHSERILEIVQDIPIERARMSGYYYNKIISTLGFIGKPEAAFEVYNRLHMSGVPSTSNTFASILNVCLRNDRLAEAQQILVNLELSDIKLEINGYNATLSALIALNRENELKGVLDKMAENSVDPDATTHRILLASKKSDSELLSSFIADHFSSPSLTFYDWKEKLLDCLAQQNEIGRAAILADELLSAYEQNPDVLTGEHPDIIASKRISSMLAFVKAYYESNQLKKLLGLVQKIVTQSEELSRAKSTSISQRMLDRNGVALNFYLAKRKKLDDEVMPQLLSLLQKHNPVILNGNSYSNILSYCKAKKLRPEAYHFLTKGINSEIINLSCEVNKVLALYNKEADETPVESLNELHGILSLMKSSNIKVFNGVTYGIFLTSFLKKKSTDLTDNQAMKFKKAKINFLEELVKEMKRTDWFLMNNKAEYVQNKHHVTFGVFGNHNVTLLCRSLDSCNAYQQMEDLYDYLMELDPDREWPTSLYYYAVSASAKKGHVMKAKSILKVAEEAKIEGRAVEKHPNEQSRLYWPIVHSLLFQNRYREAMELKESMEEKVGPTYMVTSSLLQSAIRNNRDCEEVLALAEQVVANYTPKLSLMISLVDFLSFQKTDSEIIKRMIARCNGKLSAQDLESLYAKVQQNMEN